jgi:hypothetical protein
MRRMRTRTSEVVEGRQLGLAALVTVCRGVHLASLQPLIRRNLKRRSACSSGRDEDDDFWRGLLETKRPMETKRPSRMSMAWRAIDGTYRTDRWGSFLWISDEQKRERLPMWKVLAKAATQKMVPGEGIEPPTFGLQNRCTTAVLTRPVERRRTIIEGAAGCIRPTVAVVPIRRRRRPRHWRRSGQPAPRWSGW